MNKFLSFAVFLCWTTFASGATIYSVSGTETSGAGLNSQVLYVSWTQTISFSNVEISAPIRGINGPSPTFPIDLDVTVQLMTQVGPGTSVASQIASTTVAVPTDGSAYTILFSGLDLGPGTYYLVASNSWAWPQRTPNATQVLGTGVSGGTQGYSASSGLVDPYAPASVFISDNTATLFVNVTGEAKGAAAAIPEPGSAVLLGSSLLLAALLRRAKR